MITYPLRIQCSDPLSVEIETLINRIFVSTDYECMIVPYADVAAELGVPYESVAARLNPIESNSQFLIIGRRPLH